MAEMDPIVREALKRSSQMQGNIPQNQRRRNHTEKPREVEKTKPQQSISGVSSEPMAKQEKMIAPKTENTLDMLLKNKDQSLIFLLFILLISEDSDPSLLLALMYLLI